MKKIWLIAATQPEVQPLLDKPEFRFKNDQKNSFLNAKGNLRIIVTGVGIYNTIYNMMDAFIQESPDLIINAGIAGSFRQEIPPGEVVKVIEDRFADIGAEEKDGSFLSIFDMGFENSDMPPFSAGKLVSSNLKLFEDLKSATGITVNKVHGYEKSIRAVQLQYSPDIESMEGACVMFAALKKGIPVVQIRSISNYVKPRNKSEWKINLAILNLNIVLSGWLDENC